MSNDLAVINSEAIENFFAIIAAVADVIFASLTLAYFHYSILITVFVLSIAMMLLPKVFKKSLAKASLKRTESNEKLMSEIEDVLEGFNALFMLNARDLIVSKTVAASKKSNQTAENYSNIFARMMAIVNGLSIVSQVIVLSQAGLLIFFKMTAIGAVSAAQYFSGTIFSQLTGLSANWAEMKATAPIFDKFTKITAEDDDQTDKIGSFSQQLVMKDIHFSYKDHIILKGASLRIEKRHKYALVGPSGAGKSTVLNLLNTKLADYQGSILIDGQDYKNLNAAAIREQIYYLDQDPYIFNDTIENNIKVGQQTTMTDLQKAIERAGLTSFIKKCLTVCKQFCLIMVLIFPAVKNNGSS
ncbi:ABC transporter ATP-binding protein [Oenococcus sicerae]|uniref:ABC transporter ATP-binding protein n=1 Tax=Oenococcus sicerae TaxID=2203724 RepID=A0ABX5QL71_9LACO|nr:ABC transporter ATP-binding protein [Oenococcus sicerae]QAS69547.1 ABC transporter ATP-binding protein [Oenococcus sicerae]